MRRLLSIIVLLAALAAGTWLGLRREPAPRVAGPTMKIHFIDVGQGDCILIESPEGKRMLVDAGPAESAAKVAGYLRSRGVSKLEFLVITHPHSDHIGGAPTILKDFSVGQVLDSGHIHGSKLQQQVLERIESRNIPYLLAYAGQQYRLGDNVHIEVVSPPRKLFDGTTSDANNNSLVLRVTCGDVKALLTGDMQREAEAALLASRTDIESNILKVAHHGSGDSTSIELLRQVRPGYVVISVGDGNEYGHPHKTTLRRLSPQNLGAKVFRTDQDGTIVLATDGQSIAAEVRR